MATNPTPDPSGQGATPPAGGAPPSPQGAPDQGSAPSNAPANKMQMLLAQWYQAAKQMASADPRLADGANDVANGIQKMQTALVTPQQPTPLGQQPSY